MTRQDIKRAEVAVAQVKRRIKQTQVLAPFPGIVVERLVQTGKFVNRGAQVARLVDTEHREIRAQAPLSVAGWVREGMQVSVEHQNSESLSLISYVIPVGDQRCVCSSFVLPPIARRTGRACSAKRSSRIPESHSIKPSTPISSQFAQWVVGSASCRHWSAEKSGVAIRVDITYRLNTVLVSC